MQNMETLQQVTRNKKLNFHEKSEFSLVPVPLGTKHKLFVPQKPLLIGSPKMKLTWHKLAQLEPRLSEVLKQAQAIRDDRSDSSFCANRVWFGYDEPGPGPRGFKSKVSSLVGWCSVNAGHPVLGSSEAYDLAYRTVYDALPDCRDCACL